MRSALDNLEALKRQQTLAEVTSQIHDVLGQRITILQQLLNNKDTQNYADMIPLLQNLAQDIRTDVREDAHVRSLRCFGCLLWHRYFCSG